MTKLDALKSRAFTDIVWAIRNKCFSLAEFLLLEMECDLGKVESRFVESELRAINGAMQECWVRVEESTRSVRIGN